MTELQTVEQQYDQEYRRMMEEGEVRTMEVGGVTLQIPEGVWPPYVTGQQLAEEVMPTYADVIQGGTVVDMGTGSGLLAVKAGLMGARRVVAADLNRRAVATARHNWRLNDLDPYTLDEVETDGFNNVPDEYRNGVDFIITNPPVQPFLRSNGDVDRSNDAYAWNEADAGGRAVLDEILMKGPDYLKTGGKIVTTTTTRHGHGTTQRMLDEMRDSGMISDWQAIVDETHELAPFYDQYIPIWQQLQEQDGDTRIWQDEEGTWYHSFIILELTK
ncbi:MAG: hypothetical protein RI947_1441 [Candidatus Parcubacteria bacterium]